MQLTENGDVLCGNIDERVSGGGGLIFAVRKASRSTTLYYIRTYGKSVSPQEPWSLF